MQEGRPQGASDAPQGASEVESAPAAEAQEALAPSSPPGVAASPEADAQSHEAGGSSLLRRPPARLAKLLDKLRAGAARVVELMLEWDEDNSATTDCREFRLALPVLGVRTSKSEAEELFSWLLGQAHQVQVAAAAAAAAAAAHEAGASSPLSPAPAPAPPRELEHWTLYRLLASGPGVDIEASEAAARTQLAAASTRHQEGDLWAREANGKAQNRHALRKRDGPIRGWSSTAPGGWVDSLHRGEGGDDEGLDVGARVLQGTQLDLDSDASIEEQLKAALSQRLTRVVDLFAAWDEVSARALRERESVRGCGRVRVGVSAREGARARERAWVRVPERVGA